MIFVQFLCIVCFHVVYAFDPNKVIYAVNSGGDEFIDSYGIRYERDKPVGLEQVFTSFHAKGIHIERANKDDFELYQRETYSTNSFYYEIPVNEDGDYVIVLKFCEVYFNAPYQKVFDVTLNGIKIIENLDIYGEVGKFTAHDVYIPFSIKDNNFVYKNMELFLSNGKLRLEFVKGLADNPKINAVIVYKGKVKDFPKLPPIEEEDTPDKRPASQYRQPLTRYVRDDPYYYQDFLTGFWPMLVAAATAFPVVYCLYFPKLPKLDTTEKTPKKTEYPDLKNIKAKTVNQVPRLMPPRDPYATEEPTMMWPVCFLMFSLFGILYTFCRI